MTNKGSVIGVVLLVAAISAVACGGSTQDPSSPSSPSPNSGSGTASITGTLSGAATSSSFTAAAVSLTITVSGTNISTTVPPGGTFTLNGVPAGNITLEFTGPGVNGRAVITDVQDGEQIRIIVTIHGSDTNIQITDRHKPDNGTELEGLITSIDLVNRTIVVNGKTVSVPTSAVIRHGDKTILFTDLKVGQRVHVKGSLQNSIIVASEVKLQDENQDTEADVEGTVSALTGGCPNLTFTVKSTKITTSMSTKFEGKSGCGGVANGANVAVEGTRQADGSIAAANVEVNQDHD